VIGIDNYEPAVGRLTASASDAVRFCEWVVRDGGVSPEDLTLLLSDGAQLPSSFARLGIHVQGRPSGRNIRDALRRIVLTKATGERLFVYFSGHGLNADTAAGRIDVLLPEDYRADQSGVSLAVTALADYLKAARFPEQIIFIDACRNSPTSGPITPGGMGTCEPRFPGVEQFIFLATAPGQQAAAVANAGVYTTELLNGLCGSGGAKVWDTGSGDYRVTAHRLQRYLTARVPPRARSAGVLEPQEPRLCGENAGGSPVLRILPDDPDHVPDVRLQILIEPPCARVATTLVRVERAGNQCYSCAAHPPPVELRVRPRDYRVRVLANSHTPERAFWPVDAYDDPHSLDVVLQPVADRSTNS
jgi:hypothetical protein